MQKTLWLALGVLLVLAGLAALVHPMISYRTDQRDIQIGSMKARLETRRIFPIPRVVGSMVVFSGIAIVLWGFKKN